MSGNTPILGICGGGTGGHIFPALAVVQELKRLAPQAQVHYFGKEAGMEQLLALRQQLPFYGVVLSGFVRSVSWKNVVSVWRAWVGFWKIRRVMRRLGIQAVLGTGGYVCGPVILAAASLGIPTIIHESNFIPGLTNRLLARWVSMVGVSFAPTSKYFVNQRVVVTGFPVRERLDQVTREAGCRLFGLDPAKRVLFVFPGSQAARKINQTMVEILPDFLRRLPEVQVLWMTGDADYAMVKEACEKKRFPAVLRAFVHEVPEAYAAADLVLARAGAGTVAELSATGKPAILIPYPFATANHQVHNAAVLQKYGATVVMEEKNMDGPALLGNLEKTFKRLDYMRKCGAVLRADYPQQAAQDLARILLDLAEN